MKQEALFKGEYNWFGEITMLYTKSTNEASAHKNMCIKLARKYDVSLIKVLNYFNPSSIGWKITKGE